MTLSFLTFKLICLENQGDDQSSKSNQGQGQQQGRGPAQQQSQGHEQGQRGSRQPNQGQGQNREQGQQQGRGPAQQQSQDHGQRQGQGNQRGSQQQQQQHQGQQQSAVTRPDKGQEGKERRNQRQEKPKSGPSQQQSAVAPEAREQKASALPEPPKVLPQQKPLHQQQQQPKQRSDSVQSKADSDISESLKNVEISAKQSPTKEYIPSKATMTIATAKQPGTKGRKLIIETNYIKLDLSKLVSKAYHYDVAIDPNMPKRLMTTVFELFRKENFPNAAIAFDGQKNAVTPEPLKITPNFSKKVKITDPENSREREYTVKIKEVRDLVLDFGSLRTYQQSRQYDAPLRALQFFEIVMKSAFLNKPGVQVLKNSLMCINFKLLVKINNCRLAVLSINH